MLCHPCKPAHILWHQVMAGGHTPWLALPPPGELIITHSISKQSCRVAAHHPVPTVVYSRFNAPAACQARVPATATVVNCCCSAVRWRQEVFPALLFCPRCHNPNQTPCKNRNTPIIIIKAWQVDEAHTFPDMHAIHVLVRMMALPHTTGFIKVRQHGQMISSATYNTHDQQSSCTYKYVGHPALLLF